MGLWHQVKRRPTENQMKDLSQLSITCNVETQAKLDSLNAANMQIEDRRTHHWWCAGMLPFMNPTPAFRPGDEPVLSWTAREANGEFVGQVELHQNGFGWILARLWVKKEWRRCGLARLMWTMALIHAFERTEVVGAFCDSRNTPSKNLQTSMGFRPVRAWPERQCELLMVNREKFAQYLKKAGLPAKRKVQAPGLSATLPRPGLSVPARP